MSKHNWQRDDANLPPWAMRVVKWLAWAIGSSTMVIILMIIIAAGIGAMVGVAAR